LRFGVKYKIAVKRTFRLKTEGRGVAAGTNSTTAIAHGADLRQRCWMEVRQETLLRTGRGHHLQPDRLQPIDNIPAVPAKRRLGAAPYRLWNDHAFACIYVP
jgi:hypothetical protein